jgi:hypothetical protein
VQERAGRERFGIPEPMEGWAWASLDPSDFLDFDRLDEVVAEAAARASAPALGFSVHDSDSVYLVGADSGGRRFRLVVNPEAFEDELPDQDVVEAAAWAAEHAPRAPSVDEIEEVLARDFVFAEDGLDELLGQMGLLPPDAAAGAQELGRATAASMERKPFDWDELEAVAAPELQPLRGVRSWASIAFQGVEGQLLMAEQELRVLMLATGMDTAMVEQAVRRMGMAPIAGALAFALRPSGEIAYLGHLPSREAWRSELTRQGVELGEWQPVPEEVSRDLAAAAAWVRSRRGT